MAALEGRLEALARTSQREDHQARPMDRSRDSGEGTGVRRVIVNSRPCRVVN